VEYNSLSFSEIISAWEHKTTNELRHSTEHVRTQIIYNKNKLRGVSPQENYNDSDRRLLAKLVPTLVDRGCRVVSATNPHGR
jgi:hypothetical protein